MSRRCASMVASVLLLMTFILPAFGEDNDRSILEVTGHARIMVEPNVASLTFAVETDGKDAQEAVKGNARLTDTVLKALKSMLAKEDQVETSGYSVFPIYHHEKPNQLVGYRVTNAVVVETKGLDRLGALIDEAAKAGVSRMGGLVFRHEGEDQLRTQAAVQAVQQGMETAKALANAAGVTIKRVVRISYSPGGPVFPLAESRMLRASGAQTPIEIGDIPIEAHATLVFEIE